VKLVCVFVYLLLGFVFINGIIGTSGDLKVCAERDAIMPSEGEIYLLEPWWWLFRVWW
jgi:hypothetical protein